jgi:hypothetical protein
MKTITCIAAIAIALALTKTPAAAGTKVFLLAGQSNMSGAAGPAYNDPPLPAPYHVVQSNVHILGRCDNQVWKTWQELQIGFGQVSNSFGPEVTFGYTMHTLLPKDDIYLVKFGVGGTKLGAGRNEWNVTLNNGKGGALYQEFKATVDAAMTNLAAAGKSPTIAGLLWMQGESDREGADATAYATNLTDFILRVRSDFGRPDMPIVIGRITTNYAARSALIREAQMTIPGKVGHASWINTDDLQQNLRWPWHYGTQGHIDLGKRFASQFIPVDSPTHPVEASGNKGQASK